MAKDLSWSDLYGKGGSPGDGEKIGRIEYLAASGDQSAVDLSSLTNDVLTAINAQTTRSERAGRTDYVGPLADTGLDFFAPVGVKIATEKSEFVFSADDMVGEDDNMDGGEVFFAPNPDHQHPIKIYGLRVQSGGYFSIGLENAGAMTTDLPFTAVDLVPGKNYAPYGDADEGRERTVYPPGSYIFHMDGSSGFGLDMLPFYAVGGSRFTQSLGNPHIKFEVLDTPEPPLYAALYGIDGKLLRIVNTQDGTIREDSTGLTTQTLVTDERLRSILMNILGVSAEDPTGEHIGFTPWKFQRWALNGDTRPPISLQNIDTAGLNNANRKTKNDLDTYAGKIFGGTNPKETAYGYYASYVALLDKTHTDGSKTFYYNLPSMTDGSIWLIAEQSMRGLREISLRSTGYFSITACLYNNVHTAAKILPLGGKGRDLTNGQEIALIEGFNTLEQRIYPPGEYVFESFDPVGVNITLLRSAQISNVGDPLYSQKDATMEIFRVSESAKATTYNVWWNEEGGLKIVNDDDPNDNQRQTLDGLTETTNVTQMDLNGQISAVNNNLLTNYLTKLAAADLPPNLSKVDKLRGPVLMPYEIKGAIPVVPQQTAFPMSDGILIQDGGRGSFFPGTTKGQILYKGSAETKGGIKIAFMQTKPIDPATKQPNATFPLINYLKVSFSHPWVSELIKMGSDPTALGNSSDAVAGQKVYDDAGNIVNMSRTVPGLVNQPGVYEFFLRGEWGILFTVGIGASDSEYIHFEISMTRKFGADGVFDAIYGRNGRLIRAYCSDVKPPDARYVITGLKPIVPPDPIVIDAKLDAGSVNPVQNKVLATELDTIKAEIKALAPATGTGQDMSGFAATVMVEQGLAKKADLGADGKVKPDQLPPIDSSADRGSTNAIQNGTVVRLVNEVASQNRDLQTLIGQVQSDLATARGTISQLQTDLAAAKSALDSAQLDHGFEDLGVLKTDTTIDWSIGKTTKLITVDGPKKKYIALNLKPPTERRLLTLIYTVAKPDSETGRIREIKGDGTIEAKGFSATGGYVKDIPDSGKPVVVFHIFWDGTRFIQCDLVNP
jgi:hypothetical protein